MLIAGNGDSIFRRLMAAIGRADLARDPALAHNDGRAAQPSASTPRSRRGRRERTPDDVLAAMEAADVPAGRIYTVADIAADPHYLAREMIVEIAHAPTARRSRCRASCRS